MLGKKGQSAIEYVVTYGWMVIALVAILAVLFYLNIFSPSRWMGSSNSVSGTTTFSFSDFTVLANGATTLYMKSESPYRVNITAIAVKGSNITSISPAAPFQMAPGQTRTVSGNSVLRGQAGNSLYGVQIAVYYTVEGGGQHVDSGSMTGKYS
jgi:hypothetical protein